MLVELVMRSEAEVNDLFKSREGRSIFNTNLTTLLVILILSFGDKFISPELVVNMVWTKAVKRKRFNYFLQQFGEDAKTALFFQVQTFNQTLAAVQSVVFAFGSAPEDVFS